MYLHIGGEYQIPYRFIVGIFDLDEITKDNIISIEFLSNIEENAILDVVSEEIPKSVVITVDRVYLSPISSTTLKQRLLHGISNYFY